jgi:hypothetical protein
MPHQSFDVGKDDHKLITLQKVSIVIVWRRSHHRRQLLSCEPPTTTMTTRHASRAYLDKGELLVRDKVTWELLQETSKFGSRKQSKKSVKAKKKRA